MLKFMRPLLFALLLLASPAHAGNVILDGMITQADADLVISELSNGDNLLINSTGGDLLAAFRIARTVRERGVTTRVNSTGWCQSACVLVFSAGVKREAGEHLLFMLHPATRNGKYDYEYTALLLNALIMYGVKGTPLLSKAAREQVVFGWQVAKDMNLVTSQP